MTTEAITESNRGWSKSMAGMMVALRWDGPPLTEQQLMERAATAVNTVSDAFGHVDQLDIRAMPDAGGQFVQLVVSTSASQSDCQRMTQMLKDVFSGEAADTETGRPWWKFW
jgi:hypothetical protein